MKQPIILIVLAFSLAFGFDAAGSAYAADKTALERKLEADSLLCAGKHRQAEMAYAKALRLDNTMVNAWFNLAIARYAQRDLPGAKSALESLLSIAPQDSEALYDLACLQLYEGDIETAARHLDKARDCACSSPSLLARIHQAQTFLNNLSNHVPAGKEAQWLGMIQDGLEPV